MIKECIALDCEYNTKAKENCIDIQFCRKSLADNNKTVKNKTIDECLDAIEYCKTISECKNILKQLKS